MLKIVIEMPRDKEEQILVAARECFERFGYKKTTLEDIGNKVGLNRTSFYHYFKSKAAIFVKIVTDEYQQFTTKLRQDIDDDMDCDQKILVYFEERIRYWSQQHTILPRITEVEMQQLMAAGQEIYLEIEQEEKSFVADILQNCPALV